jgi:hypothetical protein
MHFLKAGVFILWLTISLYSADTPTLQLDIYSWRMKSSVSGKEELGKSVLEVHSIVTNIGTEAVTLPTSSYKGVPDAESSGGDKIHFMFFIGFGELDGKKLVSSPLRYLPVKLQPGECTELPFIEADVSELWKSVEISFVVDQDYAVQQGWWYGSLKKKVIIGEGKNPYVVEAFTTPLDSPPPKNEAHLPAETDTKSSSLKR